MTGSIFIWFILSLLTLIFVWSLIELYLDVRKDSSIQIVAQKQS